MPDTESANAPTPADTVTTRRVATIDVGTNSIRLLVAEVRPDGTYRLLDDEKVVARLGRGMSNTGQLSDEAMQEAAIAISHMTKIAAGYDVDVLHAVATCAVREATNRTDFIKMIREMANVDVEVISGEDEARLAWISASAAFDMTKRDAAVVDIGGGSTEIVIAAGGVIEQVASLPLGAVRLTEAIADETSPERALKRLGTMVQRVLKTTVRKPPAQPRLIIGTGGTFTALALLDRRLHAPDRPDRGSVRGYEVKRSSLRHHIDALVGMTPAERAAAGGLTQERAEIIVAGLMIAEGVMRRLGANRLRVHDRGIRDGLLISMSRQMFPRSDAAPAAAHDRMAEVRGFAERCRYEKRHSEQVRRLALRLYDDLQSIEDCASPDPVEREWLEAAAILHDIGYYINYAKHHKHSYHLIVHAELAGFDARELEIIANVARYHRRAHPKRKHLEFAHLAGADQEVVRRLAAILRVADGLDRAHTSNVTDVRLESGGPGTVEVVLRAAQRPDVDIWGAERKSRLFEKVFKLAPKIRWEPT